MTETLRVLVVEDSRTDAELLMRALERPGLKISWGQAQSASELQTLLERQSWDVVVADFSLPQFSAMAALMIVRERELDLPFVVVSGVVGEETAVAAMRAGARDFVTKNDLARLAPAVEREVRGARERRAWQAAAATPPTREELQQATPGMLEWFMPLALATSFTLIVTAVVELLQEYYLPALGVWQATLLVVGVAGPVAALSFYYLSSRRRALMQRVIEEYVEHRRLNEMRQHLADRTRELESKIAERQRYERHLETQHGVTRILAGSRPLNEATRDLLESLCQMLDWEVGEFWSLDSVGVHLHRASQFPSDPPQSLSPLIARQVDVRERIAYRVWDGGRPVWISDVSADEPQLAAMAAGQGGVRSALAFPIRLGQEMLGIMVLTASGLRAADPELLEVLEDIGNQIGQFIERQRAETALQRAREELELRVRRRTAELASLNEALRRSEANLRQAQQMAHLGSFEAYAPFRVAYGNYWSEEACRILALDPTRVDLSMDAFVKDVVHLEDRARMEQELCRMEECHGAFELEHRVVRPDASTRFVRLSGEPCFDEAGRLVKLVGTLHDITERKQLEKQVLEVSENEQRRIGQDLHDDLCQHLAGIEFMSQALSQRLEQDEHAEAALARQVTELVRGAINQTRGLARGLSPVQLESRGLTPALEDLAQHVHRLFHIDCQLVADPRIEVRNVTVATHLYRIAQEAINNAIRHGKADRITVELHGDEELACLRVGDNGSGFAAVKDETGKGMGLRIMHYRAGMIGASLNVIPRPRHGVLVECTFRSEP